VSRSPEEISARIRATLATSEPGLSCERGTPERKIIDACSEAISEGYVDMYLVGSLLDLDNKVGLELEQFVGVFGFGRLQGRKASGVVRMKTATALSTDQLIVVGSQFYTKGSQTNAGGARLYFASTQAVTLTAGSLTVDIPVQCTEAGTKGNVPPDSITSFGSAIATSTVTNLVAFSGGVDVENDAELRQRFKDTLLRNIAGTTDWYRALSLQNDKVGRVAVYGPTTLYRTQLKAPSTQTNLSTMVSQDPFGRSDVKYVWSDMESVFINLGQSNEKFFNPGSTNDYTLAWPYFTRISTGQIAQNDIVDLEFQYTTRCSRNEPGSGITNKVDVFVDGVDPFTVTERTAILPSTTLQLVSTPTTAWNYKGNFERVPTAAYPAPGDPAQGSRFVRLSSVPIVTFPSSITVNGTVYNQGQHYHLIRSTTTLAGSHREITGLEWPSGVSGTITDNTQLTLTYIYNRVPELLSAVMDTSKQICTDVMVHQAKWNYVIPCLSVQYARTYSPSSVEAAIKDHLTRYFSAMQYGQQVKITQLLMAVQQIIGVENVTLVTDTALGAGNYGIGVSTDPQGTYVTQVADFKFADNVLPILQDVKITRKSEI
jgi:uncharacterized phage protein gp47/JayE